jgi:3-oxoacyl-[acyl-carrier protein] reductase
VRQLRALVTGSSRGIGRGIASELASAGYVVAVNGRNPRAVENTTCMIANSHGVTGDVSDVRGANAVVDAATHALGGLDVLVCNVGSGRRSAAETANSVWTSTFDLNFFSAVHCIDAALPALKQSGGSIVCISSICAVETISDAPVPYSVAKAALNAYIRISSRTLGRFGVRINAVLPGNIYFEGSTWFDKQSLEPAKVEEYINDEVPLQRFGTPSEIAKAVRFLAGDDSQFTTGALLVVDGGQTRLI